MHPWASGWHHHHHRGGRRVVWFALGAVAATWYHHAKERRDVQGGWGCTWRHRRELEALRAAGTGEAAPAELEYSREWRLQYPPPPLRSQQPASPARTAPSPPPPAEMPPMPERLPGDWETVRRERWSPPSSQPPPEWEEEKERVREFTKQAEEKITDFSEATLDSILSTVESLKAKLAEHRAQKAASAQKEEELLEKARKNPPRWV